MAALDVGDKIVVSTVGGEFALFNRAAAAAEVGMA